MMLSPLLDLAEIQASDAMATREAVAPWERRATSLIVERAKSQASRQRTLLPLRHSVSHTEENGGPVDWADDGFEEPRVAAVGLSLAAGTRPVGQPNAMGQWSPATPAILAAATMGANEAENTEPEAILRPQASLAIAKSRAAGKPQPPPGQHVSAPSARLSERQDAGKLAKEAPPVMTDTVNTTAGTFHVSYFMEASSLPRRVVLDVANILGPERARDLARLIGVKEALESRGCEVHGFLDQRVFGEVFAKHRRAVENGPAASQGNPYSAYVSTWRHLEGTGRFSTTASRYEEADRLVLQFATVNNGAIAIGSENYANQRKDYPWMGQEPERILRISGHGNVIFVRNDCVPGARSNHCTPPWAGGPVKTAHHMRARAPSPTARVAPESRGEIRDCPPAGPEFRDDARKRLQCYLGELRLRNQRAGSAAWIKGALDAIDAATIVATHSATVSHVRDALALRHARGDTGEEYVAYRILEGRICGFVDGLAQ